MTNSISNAYAMTPYFTVTGAHRLIAFMKAVFDAEVVKDNRYDDGTLQHARLRVEGCIIMLNEASDDFAANQSQMHLYVANIEDIYDRGLRHGATSLMAPMLRPHGERMAGFEDPCGNIWWVAEQA